jgi:hypothetical protein
MITVYLSDGSPISVEESDKDLFILLTGATENPQNTDLPIKSPVTVSTNVDTPSEGNQTSEPYSPPVTPTSAQLGASKTNSVEINSETTPEG